MFGPDLIAFLKDQNLKCFLIGAKLLMPGVEKGKIIYNI
jgi:hypothetical protein